MRSRRWIRTLILASLIFVLIVYEENQKSIAIAVIIVLLNRSNYEEYRLAIESFECYVLYHNYTWIVIDLSANITLRRLCPHEDFMFARHCITAKVMEEQSGIQWFLFVDADMGVINPNHLIEEWIDNSVDLIFYSRIFNHEVMAGSYLAKNTPYTWQFLRFWADYESKLPFTPFGSDNGAIHVGELFFVDVYLLELVVMNVLLEFVLPKRVSERKFCERIWFEAKDFGDLNIYVACVRNITDEALALSNRVRILPKGEAWARDTWLTDSMWCERDFILHGWQKRKNDRVVFGGWPSPFVSHHFNLSLCTDRNTISSNWQYKDTFMKSNFQIDGWLNKVIANSKHEFNKHLKLAASYRGQ
uniref:Nucleotide-diphospho-sugar transferase domain-containing protein n=1 Tax=Setaria digitata TaxID=48799 RepID=A0A915Q6U6_9BILA